MARTKASSTKSTDGSSGASTISKKKSKKNKCKALALEKVSSEIIGASIPMLNPVVVETGWLKSIQIVGDGKLEFNDSWAEWILLMISMVNSNYPDRLTSKLVDNNVLSDGVNIMTELVEYPLSDEVEYKTYKLPNSIYYVEIRNDGEAIIKAIKGLLAILAIPMKDVTVDIVPLNIKINGINTAYKDAKRIAKKDTLYDIIRKYHADQIRTNAINISAITVFGYKQKTKGTMQALILFMTWAESSYGSTLELAGVRCSTDGVGLTTAHNIDEYGEGFTKVKIGKYYMYAANDNTTILNYIYNISIGIGLSPELIEIEYEIIELS